MAYRDPAQPTSSLTRDERIIGVWIALSGMITVMIGAYAAHGLAARVSDTLVNAAQTGVRYQAWHTLAMLVLLVGQRVFILRGWRLPIILWSLGTLAFSGSLYAMSMGGLPVGLVTPLGGVLLMAGWLALGRAFMSGR